MDTFVDSSWYFLRYLDSKNSTAPCDPEKANKYMPVDLYVGGKEHGMIYEPLPRENLNLHFQKQRHRSTAQ